MSCPHTMSLVALITLGLLTPCHLSPSEARIAALCPEIAPCDCFSINSVYIEIYCENKGLQDIPDFTQVVFNHTVGAVLLAKNNITTVREEAFNGLVPRELLDEQEEGQSIKLDLSDNKIYSVHADAFATFLRPHFKKPRLQVMLENNKLTNVGFLFEPCVAEFAVIDVTGNPILCDCEVFNITYGAEYQVNGLCSAPEKYKDKGIHEVFYPERSDMKDDEAAMTAGQGAREECGVEGPLLRYGCRCDRWMTEEIFETEEEICEADNDDDDDDGDDGNSVTGGATQAYGKEIFSLLLVMGVAMLLPQL